MTPEIKAEHKKYKENWQLLYDLFEKLPEEKLSWSISSENRTLKEQLAHIVMVQYCHVAVIKEGPSAWKECHREGYWSAKTKQELLEEYIKSDRELPNVLEKADPDKMIDWTEGDYKTLKDHLVTITDHEIFHQGQLIPYIRTLGGEYFPDSWSVHGY